MSSLAGTKTRINLFSLYYLIPFLFLIMTGSGITFLGSLCAPNNRWLVLFLLLNVFIFKKKFFRHFDVLLFIILSSYFGWCVLTSFWSEVPNLSFMKSGIALVIAFTLIRTGMEWVNINRWVNTFNYLFFIVLFSLLSGFLGHYAAADLTYNHIGDAITYQGLVGNSNMFGILMVMSLPFLIWQSYKVWPNIKKRIVWLMLTSSCLYWLFLSYSRAAILTSTFIFMGFLFSIDFNKKIKIFFLSCVISVATVILLPSFIDNAMVSLNKWIFKGNTSSLFYSRHENWDQSYKAALDGGWLGYGYGASEGQTEFSLDGRLKSWGYGREKGNSQLAIMEETGIIGLILYLVFICYLFCKLFILFHKTKDRDFRVLIGIVSGLFTGMIIHSAFEAWWDAPGSQESIYFWMLVGVIKGLEIMNSRKEMIYHSAPLHSKFN